MILKLIFFDSFQNCLILFCLSSCISRIKKKKKTGFTNYFCLIHVDIFFCLLVIVLLLLLITHETHIDFAINWCNHYRGVG